MPVIRNYQFPGGRHAAPKPAYADSALLTELVAFGKRHGLTESRVGTIVTYNGLLGHLRSGAALKASTMARVRAAMADYEART